MLKIELHNDVKKIDKQIQALEWQIKQDTNEKDISIHTQALDDLINHRNKLKHGTIKCTIAINNDLDITIIGEDDLLKKIFKRCGTRAGD